jgi:hypothetical protein
MKDKHEFYRRVAEIIANHRTELGGLSASDVEMAPHTHPAMAGIGRFIYAPKFAAVRFSGNMFNGYYLPDGVILRSAFERRPSPQT